MSQYFQTMENDPFGGEEIEFKNCSDYLGPWVQAPKQAEKQKSGIKQLKKLKNNRNIELHFERFAAQKFLKNPQWFNQTLEVFDENRQKIVPIKGVKMKNRNYSSALAKERSTYPVDFEEEWTRKTLVPLTSTMYVYHCKGDTNSMIKSPKNSQKNRTQTICHSKTHQEFSKSKRKVINLGSSNLQNILRLKQKIRTKNQTCVRKMKEKISQGQEDPNLNEKAWTSAVLEGENKPKKYQILEKDRDNILSKNYWRDWKYFKRDKPQLQKCVRPNGYPIIFH